MGDEIEPTPAPPAPAEPEPDPHAESHVKLSELEVQVAGLADRVSALEAEPAAEPERTEVVPRTEEPVEETKDEPPAAEPSGERHTGLFI